MSGLISPMVTFPAEGPCRLQEMRGEWEPPMRFGQQPETLAEQMEATDNASERVQTRESWEEEMRSRYEASASNRVPIWKFSEEESKARGAENAGNNIQTLVKSAESTPALPEGSSSEMDIDNDVSERLPGSRSSVRGRYASIPSTQRNPSTTSKSLRGAANEDTQQDGISSNSNHLSRQVSQSSLQSSEISTATTKASSPASPQTENGPSDVTYLKEPESHSNGSKDAAATTQAPTPPPSQERIAMNLRDHPGVPHYTCATPKCNSVHLLDSYTYDQEECPDLDLTEPRYSEFCKPCRVRWSSQDLHDWICDNDANDPAKPYANGAVAVDRWRPSVPKMLAERGMYNWVLAQEELAMNTVMEKREHWRREEE